MSDVEYVITKMKEFEILLTKLGAKGKGLGIMINSIKSKIPKETRQKLKQLQEQRNDLAHFTEKGLLDTLEDRGNFEQTASEIIDELKEIMPPEEGTGYPAIFYAIILGFIGYYLIKFLS